MRQLGWLILIFIACSCSIDRTTPELSTEETEVLEEYQAGNNGLIITAADEPGEKLVLCLTFVNKEDLDFLSKQEVLFYHTDATGEYRPVIPGDESSARLSGSVVTDSVGRIYLEFR